MVHFFLSALYITRNCVRTTTSLKLAIEIFSIRKILVSDHFDKLAFSQSIKFTDDVIFSQADTLTSCPLDANSIITFRAYRRLIVVIRPVCHEKLGWGWAWPFRRRWRFLWYVPGMHVVVFTRSSSVARALASAPICCSILQYTKRTKPSADTWAIDPWVRVVPSFLCASLFQSVCVRVGDDVFLVATWNLFVIFTRYRMPLLGAFSCRPGVSPEPSAARMPLLILWLSPTGYCCKETERIIRSRVYEQSCMVSLVICAARWLVYDVLFLCSVVFFMRLVLYRGMYYYFKLTLLRFKAHYYIVSESK